VPSGATCSVLAGVRGQPDGVVQEHLIGAGLNQQRGQAGQRGEDRAGQRGGPLPGGQVPAGVPAHGVVAEQRIGPVLGVHAGPRARDVGPRGEDRDGGGLRQAPIARGEQRGHREPAPGRITRHQDPRRADARFEQPGVGGQAVLDRGRVGMLGGEPVVALPTTVPCARLHVRHLLWEWGLNGLAANTELLTSELVTNAVQATAGQQQAAIRLRLSSDYARVLVEVRDADPRPPAPKALGEGGTPDPGEEGGAGCSWWRR